jgi:hypothetical protein
MSYAIPGRNIDIEVQAGPDRSGSGRGGEVTEIGLDRNGTGFGAPQHTQAVRRPSPYVRMNQHVSGKAGPFSLYLGE